MLSAFGTRDPKILGGVPVFTGTSVPIAILAEYRHAGLPLYEFLLDFPAVPRAQGKKAWAWLAKQDATGLEHVLGVALKPPPPFAARPTRQGSGQKRSAP